MIGLLFKINGDNSPFRKTMADTKKEAASGGQTVGKAFGEQFKGAMMRFLGAGAIISAIMKATQDALKIDSGAMKLGVDVEAFQVLEKAAQMLGMSVDELREVAPYAAGEFEDLVEKIKSGGGILDSETVAMLADTADAMDRLWAQMQPALGFFAKSVSWVIGQGQKWLTVASGSAMDIAGRATGNKDLKQAGQELQREGMAENVQFGASPLASSRREAAKRFRDAQSQNRNLIAARAASLTEGFSGANAGNLGSMPFAGGTITALVDAMEKTAKETEKVRQTMEKKL